MSGRRTIQLRYAAQLAAAAGRPGERVEIENGVGLRDVLSSAADRHGEGFARMVFADDGAIHPTLLVAVDGEMAAHAGDVALDGASDVLIMMPMAGG